MMVILFSLLAFLFSCACVRIFSIFLKFVLSHIINISFHSSSSSSVYTVQLKRNHHTGLNKNDDDDDAHSTPRATLVLVVVVVEYLNKENCRQRW